MFYIPYVSTETPAVLTNAQWHDIGIEYIMCAIDDVITRYSDAMTLLSLGKYMGFEGHTILDVSKVHFNAKGYYIARHPTSGETWKYTEEALCQWIQDVRPDYILPSHAISRPIGLVWDRPYTLLTKPIHDALSGIAYTCHGCTYITSPDNQKAHEIIVPHCTCPTCTQGFTKAYLAHIFQHVPLLAYRLLLSHNIVHLLQYS